MIIQQCDGCGTQSPDIGGLHAANNWFEIVVVDRKDNFQAEKVKKTYLLCRTCFDPIKGILKITEK